MTNRPMLSVDRETIKAILGRSGNGYMAAWNELRALFDNPTQGEPIIAAELVALLRADLRQQVEAYRAEVSGNYRGQPVAIFEIDTSGYRARIILDPEQPFPQSGTKLYAEQPAPVAVVMPELKTPYYKVVPTKFGNKEGFWQITPDSSIVYDNRDEAQARADARNASRAQHFFDSLKPCLEEVARLNGVKP